MASDPNCTAVDGSIAVDRVEGLVVVVVVDTVVLYMGSRVDLAASSVAQLVPVAFPVAVHLFLAQPSRLIADKLVVSVVAVAACFVVELVAVEVVLVAGNLVEIVSFVVAMAHFL